MRSVRSFSLAGLLILVAAIAIAVGGWSTSVRLRRERDELTQLLGLRSESPSDAYIRDMPLSVTLSDQGGMRTGHDWFATVNSGGAGLLEIQALSGPITAPFAVTNKQLAALREALIATRFFDLPRDHGELVPDGSTQTITVVVGEYAKTVQIKFLGNLANRADQFSSLTPRHAAGALSVWLLLRGWFTHPEAFDGRQYDLHYLSSPKRSRRRKILEGRPTIDPSVN